MTVSLHQALERFNGQYLDFPPFRKALQEVQHHLALYRETGVVKHLVIQGESGTGKTTLCHILYKMHPRRQLPERDLIPLLMVTVPATATVSGLAEEILHQLGDPDPSTRSIAAKTHRIIVLIKALGVEVLLLDEAQHIQDRGKLYTQYMVGDWLKTLIDAIGIPVVLLGLPRVDNLLQVNEQLRRRFGRRLNLALGQTPDVSVETECLELLNSFGPGLPLPLRFGATPWSEVALRIYYACDGRVSYIKQILGGAIRIAHERSSEVIDLAILEETFTQEISAVCKGALNPFSATFEFRALTRPGEPFERVMNARAGRRSRHALAA